MTSNPNDSRGQTELANDSVYFEPQQLRSNLRSKAVRGTAFNIGSQAVTVCCNLASIAVIGRILSEDDYGLVGMATTWTALAFVLQNLGLAATIVQRPQISRQQASWLWIISVAAGCLLSLVSVAISGLLARFYGEPKVAAIVSTLGLGFVIRAAGSTHSALLERAMKFRELAVITIVAQLAGLLTGISCAFAGLEYWSLVAMLLTSGAVRTLGCWWGCKWRPTLTPGTDNGMLDLLRFGGFVTATSLTNYLATNLDGILIGRIFGAGELGYYKRAYSLLQQPTKQVLPVIRKVGDAALSRVQDDHKKFNESALSVLHFNLIVGTPLVVLMGLAAHPIVRIVMGAKWEPSASIFAAMVPLTWVHLTTTVGTMCFFASGKVKEMSGWNLVNCLLAVIGIVAGTPWGPVGVGASYSLSGVFIRTPYLFYRLRCVPGFEPALFLRTASAYGASGLLTGGLAWSLVRLLKPSSDWLELSLYAVSIGALYGLLCFLVRPMREQASALGKVVTSALRSKTT